MNEVDKYIAAFPLEIQQILREIRQMVKSLAPEAVESITYGMPAYKLNRKPLIYFAAFKKHIGVYATPVAHQAFKKELSAYRQGKGSVQFPLNEPIPYSLIGEMIKFKIALADPDNQSG